jgi:putative DNA-invertase from lambdoid prophage Rac
MRIYGYFRENPNRLKNLQDRINLNKFGYSIPSNRLIIESVTVETSVIYRDKFMALINLTLEEEDLLIVKSFDCLGKDFKEIYNSVHKIYQKKYKSHMFRLL